MTDVGVGSGALLGVLYAFEILLRELIANIAGVQSRRRLKKHNFDFFRSERLMFDSARHDEELTSSNLNNSVTKPHV